MLVTVQEFRTRVQTCPMAERFSDLMTKKQGYKQMIEIAGTLGTLGKQIGKTQKQKQSNSKKQDRCMD